MGVVAQTRKPGVLEKRCWAGRQQIAAVAWGDYWEGKFSPWRPESNWAGGDLGVRLREKRGEKLRIII